MSINLLDERLIPYDLIIRLLERICFEDSSYVSYSAAILIFMPGLAEIRRLNDLLAEHLSFGQGEDFKIYPLHSSLSSENQGAVFEIPPVGVRKIVIGVSSASDGSFALTSNYITATNIAETGITIPDITCVIDTGKHREMRYVVPDGTALLCTHTPSSDLTRSGKSVGWWKPSLRGAMRLRGEDARAVFNVRKPIFMKFRIEAYLVILQGGLCFHLFTKVRHDTQVTSLLILA